MICKLKDIFEAAEKNGFAVPAFNYSDQWEMYSIIEAACEMDSPVIMQTNMQVIETHSLEVLGALGIIKAKNSPVPVVNHLDHCTEVDICRKAADAGYMSLMLDGSKLPVSENAAIINTLYDYCEGKGTAIEGEIGHIKGKNEEGCFKGEDFLADVDEVVELVSKTHLTSLAVGIGNAHGFYAEEPKLNIKRLKEIHEAVDIPLVLHGGSGLARDAVRAAIDGGIRKVNVGTELHSKYLKSMRFFLNEEPDAINVINMMNKVKEDIKAVVKGWIVTVRAEGKASLFR